jgi:hypothetical protein
MPSLVLTGVLPRAAASVVPRLLQGLEQRRNKQQQEVVARVLDPQRLTASLSLVALDWPAGVPKEAVRRFLDSPEASAVVQELLTFRLAAAAGEAADRIRDTWLRTGAAALRRPGDAAVPAFLHAAFTVLDEQCTVIATDVRTEYPAIAGDIRQRAEFRRLGNTLDAIERHNRALAAGGDPQDTDRVLAQYRRQVARAHGFIEPPDFETRRQVPVDLLYVCPTFHSAERGTTLTLDQLEAALDRTVVLGSPGAGKSTAAQVLAHRAAVRPDGLVPFVIVLREFAQALGEHSVVEHLERRARTYYQCELPPGLTESLLLAGKATVIFDGLDELIDTRMRREVTDVVGLFCERFPLAPVLVTSRAVGYDQAPMDPSCFTALRIADFTDADVEEYVHKWFTQQTRIAPEERSRLAEAFITESRVSPDLRTNPLMLALLCILYRGERYIPRNRPAVYEKCANLLFEKWDSSRQIFVELQAGHMVDPAIKHLAYWMLTHGEAQEGVTETALIAETSKYLRQRVFEEDHLAGSAARDFVAFCRGRGWVFTDTGTNADGEPLYQFTHRTFMEYFAAYHLTRLHNTPEAAADALRSRILRGEWDVVGQLVVQIMDRHSDGGADRLLAALLTTDTSTEAWAFACRCLAVVPVSPALARRITAAAIDLYLRDTGAAGTTLLAPLLNTFTSHNIAVVRAEVMARLRQAIEHGSPADRRMAIFFAIHDHKQPHSANGDIPGDSARFWREVLLELRPSVHTTVVRDGMLKVAGFYNGWITFEELTEDGYRVFFRMGEIPRPGRRFIAPVTHLLDVLWRPAEKAPARANLTAFAKALTSTRRTPWPIELPGLVADRNAKLLLPDLGNVPIPDRRKARRQAPAGLSADQYFGLAAAFLMVVELGAAFGQHVMPATPEALPAFAEGLRPYVEARHGAAPAPLAGPAGCSNGALLVAWARNELSFLDLQG